MPYEDLERAASQSKALRDLIIANSGGREDLDARQRIAHLVSAPSVEDAECRTLLLAIERHAQLLFSASGHVAWAHGKTPGAYVLRLQILRNLDAFNKRLATIEAERSSLAQSRNGAEAGEKRKP